MKAIAATLVVAACWRGPATPGGGATMDDLNWLAGAWHSEQLDSYWVRAGHTLYGIALTDRTCEVNTISDRTGTGRPQPITLSTAEWSWETPGAVERMSFALVSASPQRLEFADAHERVVVVARTARGWRGEFHQPNAQAVAFEMTPGSLAAPPPDMPLPERMTLGAARATERTIVIGRRGEVVFAIGIVEAMYEGRRPRHGTFWRIWRASGDGWRLVTGAVQLE